MSKWRAHFLLLAVSMVFIAAGADAQPAATKPSTAAAVTVPEGGMPHYIRPETPEQRLERLGTQEDPGIDPDPEQVFWRFGKQFTIDKFEKQWARYTDQPGWVRPLANLNITNEIYQENDKYVWVWIPVPEARTAEEDVKPTSRFDEESVKYFETLRGEFAPIDLPSAGTTVRFEESSTGLPTTGSWRNGAAIADMNEDGNVDLVFPPPRGQAAAPAIFLGDGKGAWNRWSIKWPRPFNYGTVVTSDFNKDGHVDLAFSIHLTGVAVFLGDGKGNFTEVTDGLSKDFPTRRMIATDVDADGWTDIVAISEGPVGRGSDVKNKAHGSLRAYLNRKKGKSWEGFNVAEPREYLGGDYLTAGMFNDDRYPDFAGASVYFNSTHTMFLSKGVSEYDSATKGMLIPGRSYYHATSAGRFVRDAKRDDFIVSFVRHWPSTLDPNVVPKPPAEKISGIDRITFVDGEAKRVPILRWSGARRINGMDAGDIDGDGNTDIAYTNAQTQEVKVLMGDGAGGFRKGEVAGLKLEPQRTYDLQLVDLNGDKRLDVLLAYESDETTAFAEKNGSIRVFLNRGTDPVK